MKVWAIPVGQEVIPTSRFPPNDAAGASVATGAGARRQRDPGDRRTSVDLLPRDERERCFDDRLTVSNRLGGADGVDRFAGKRRFVDVNIGGQHDDVGGGDFSLGQALLGSDGALGFNLDLMAHGGRGALERFGRHEGVSDAGWAGSDSNNSFHKRVKISKSFER